MWIGILEGSQVAICGAVIGHRRAPAGMNDCDFLTDGDRIPHDFAYLGIIAGLVGEKLVLGFTFVIITIIAGQEMAHLVHPVAALIAMAWPVLAVL